MKNWLKWLIAGNEIAELNRWRVMWHEYRAWLSEFKPVGLALDNLKAEVTGQQLNACFPPSVDGPWTVSGLRERMRQDATASAEEVQRLRGLLKEASDYLDTNNLTSIGSGSILHQRFKDAVSGN